MKMKCKEVYQILEAVSQQRELEIDEAGINLLKENKLVSLISEKTYRKRQTTAEKLRALNIEKERIIEEFNSQAGKAVNLETMRVWGKKKRQKKEELAERLSKKIEELKFDQNLVETEIKLLSQEKHDTNYLKTPYGYIKLSKKGITKKEQLENAMSRLEGIAFEEFDRQIKEKGRRIQERLERFENSLDYLVNEKGYSEKDERVINFALITSGLEKDIGEFEFDQDDYNQLNLLSIAANQNNAVIDEIFQIMLSNDYQENMHTKTLAAIISQIPEEKAEEKYRRFETVRGLLLKNDYKPYEVDYLAAHLAGRNEPAKDAVNVCHSIYQKLEHYGSGFETKIAALLLMDGKGTLDERAEKLQKAFDLGYNLYQWNNITDPIAAVAALMPGTIEENIYILNHISKKLKDKKGFETDLVKKALMLLNPGRIYETYLNKTHEEFKKSRSRPENVSEEAVLERYDRFRKIQQYMLNNSWQKDSKVTNCAITLSKLEDEVSEIYKRMMVINDNIYNLKWQNYNRLAAVALTTIQEGDINKLWKQLDEITRIMVSDGYPKKYYTWLNGANILRIPGELSLKEKYRRFDYRRFDKIEYELTIIEKGWKRHGKNTGLIASNLVRYGGTPEEIVKQHRHTETTIIQKAKANNLQYWDDFPMGVAALLLMDSEESLDNSADKLITSLKALHQKNYTQDSACYISAAALALMPGETEENMRLFLQVTRKLETDGLQKYGLRAFSIILNNTSLQSYHNRIKDE